MWDTHTVDIVLAEGDWTPLRSKGDHHWYGSASPHHVFAAQFEGFVDLLPYAVLSLESDDDAYIFLDDHIAWGQEILSHPGIHPYPGPANLPWTIILPPFAGLHKLTVKFAERHEVESGIRIKINNQPLRALPRVTVTMESALLTLHGQEVLTAFLGAPKGHEVEDIVAGTVTCAGAPVVAAAWSEDKLMVQFHQQDLAGLKLGTRIELTVTGQCTDGTWFAGTAVVQVVASPPGSPQAQETAEAAV